MKRKSESAAGPINDEPKIAKTAPEDSEADESGEEGIEEIRDDDDDNWTMIIKAAWNDGSIISTCIKLFFLSVPTPIICIIYEQSPAE